MDGFCMLLYEEFGRDELESITNETLTPRIEIPALMVHDPADNVTPVEDSHAIARVWRNAHLVETQGLGHTVALPSRDIHD
jgi:pimeloyl-ACP methyl ester carboxylesterase